MIDILLISSKDSSERFFYKISSLSTMIYKNPFWEALVSFSNQSGSSLSFTYDCSKSDILDIMNILNDPLHGFNYILSKDTDPNEVYRYLDQYGNYLCLYYLAKNSGYSNIMGYPISMSQVQFLKDVINIPIHVSNAIWENIEFMIKILLLYPDSDILYTLTLHKIFSSKSQNEILDMMEDSISIIRMTPGEVDTFKILEAIRLAKISRIEKSSNILSILDWSFNLNSFFDPRVSTLHTIYNNINNINIKSMDGFMISPSTFRIVFGIQPTKYYIDTFNMSSSVTLKTEEPKSGIPSIPSLNIKRPIKYIKLDNILDTILYNIIFLFDPILWKFIEYKGKYTDDINIAEDLSKIDSILLDKWMLYRGIINLQGENRYVTHVPRITDIQSIEKNGLIKFTDDPLKYYNKYCIYMERDIANKIAIMIKRYQIMESILS